MDMQCPLLSKETTEVLLDYCSQKTDPETTRSIERHISECAQCQVFADAQKSVWAALDSWEDVEISSGFNRSLYARIDAAENSSWWTRLWSGSWGQSLVTPFGWRPAMPVATACLTVAAAFFLYSPAPRPLVEQNASGQVVKESVDLDQVQTTLDDMEMLKQLSSPSSGRSAKI
jgi:hypothetical protein